AAGGPHVDVVDADRVEGAGAADVVVPLRVAAVDDRVAGLEQLGELVDRLLRRPAGRDHDPHGPRRVELLHELLERAHAGGAVAGRRLDRVGAEVEGDDLVVRVAVDAMDHVAAHLPQPDEAELHGYSPSTRTTGSPWSRSVR